MTDRLLAFVTIAALGLGASSARADPIAWIDQDLDAALAEAASCGGEVLVDVYATWCLPCQRLAAEVFTAPEVVAAADGMVAVKVDAEAEGGPEVRERYHVHTYPTVLVLDARGREVDRIIGFSPAGDFARELESIRRGPESFGEVLTHLAAAASSTTLVQTAFDAGYSAAACGEYAAADALLRGVVDADPANTTGLAARALLTLGKFRHLRGAEEFDLAIGVFAELRERFPGSPEADEALVQTGIAHLGADRVPSAVAAFEFYLQQDPDDADRANAVAFTLALEGEALEWAEEVAESGLELDPGDASLWDTLAEVRFARGDRAGATAAIDRAIALEPDRAYYADQRTRFVATDE